MKLLLASLLAFSVLARAQSLPPPTLSTDGDGAVVIKAPPGAKAYYTIDGSAPHAKSGPYIDPVVMPIGGKVRAISASEDRKTVSKAVEIDLPLIPTFARVPESTLPCTHDRDYPVYEFAKRHAAVTAAVKQKKPALVFVGDSITHMLGGEPADRPQPGKEVWEKYYASRNAANLGFGYDFTENTLWRMQHGELDGAAAKAVVVVNIGTNNTARDSAPDIVAGIHAVVMEIQRKKPEAKVLLLGLFPRGAKPDATLEKIRQVNAQLASLRGLEGVTFLDVGAKLVQPDGSISQEIMGDFLHPTAQGYAIIAEAIEPAIKKLMGE